jgi:cytochrome b6-f complex iron-sulfur subunit
MTESTPATRTSRRGLLDFLLKVSVVGWLGSVLYPVVSYLRPLSSSGPAGPVVLTRSEVAEVERKKFAIVPAGPKRVLVLEDADGEIHALDARCTHEGCTVRYVPGEAVISCACHDARFDLQGRVLAGPPPRPLATHPAWRDGDGSIVVDVKNT